MTNDEIDAAIRAAIVGALPEYGSADLVSTTETDFAIYRAGMEAQSAEVERLRLERDDMMRERDSAEVDLESVCDERDAANAALFQSQEAAKSLLTECEAHKAVAQRNIMAADRAEAAHDLIKKMRDEWKSDALQYQSERDAARIAADDLAAENERLRQHVTRLIDGCNGMIGLVQLVATRDDLPTGLDDVMLLSHRVTEAKAAVDAANGEMKCQNR